MRKSPIHHHVRQHQRQINNGKTTVHDYWRGKGERKPKLARPRIARPKPEIEESKTKFFIRIVYNNLSSESFPVTATSYPEAIETGLIIRTNISPPMQVEVTKQ